MVASNPEVYKLCRSWVNAINIPVRELDNLGSVLRGCRKGMESIDGIDIPDRDDEYDIYQDGDVNLSEVAFSTEPTPVQWQEAPIVENSVNTTTRAGHGFAATDPANPASQVKQDETARLSKEIVDLAVEEARLIAALGTTNDREERQKLTTELLEILKKSDELSFEVGNEEEKDVFQDVAYKATNNNSTAINSFVEAKDDGWNDGGMVKTEMDKNAIPNGSSQVVAQQLGQQLGFETRQSTGRKTPPHLRGIGGRRK
ncbi:hypothetical protein GGR51DRAFT_487882 [Nemania sp. FL0031]|nr:hypothetical protein GGR51DRAFT_487882 [Nemania sp. FL0031]